MKKVTSVLLSITIALSVIILTPSTDASAAINDGNKLSVDINLEVGHYTASTDTFTPLKTGETLKAGTEITVRICPKNDFLVGVTRYVVMFSNSYLQIAGSGNAAFTPNLKNTFYAQVAASYSGADHIPSDIWPSGMVTNGDYNTYTAVAVNNQANSNSANGGYPGLLPGTWLFRFNLKVIKDITAGSNARIWMDNRWLRQPSNPTGAMYFSKCESADQLSATGNSVAYNFIVDLKDADIKLPLTSSTPVAPTLAASTKAITNKSVTVTITYPGGATNKQYKLKSAGIWKTYSSPFSLPANDTVYAQYKNAAGALSSTGTLVVGNIDKTAPKITALTVANNGYTKNNVTVTVSDANYSSKSVTLNGKATAWPGGNVFSTGGKYVITAKDKAGNSAQYTFTVDKTLPAITAKTVADNGYTKSNVTVTVSDTNYSSKSVTKNGKATAWPGSNVFSSDGKYIITAKDKAGNVKVYTFTIDKTVPQITVKNLSGSILANNGSAKGGATFSATDTNLKTKSIKKNGSAITWPTGNRVTSKGTYVIAAFDKAGNSKTFTFKVT